MCQLPSLVEQQTTPAFRKACDILITNGGHNDVTTKQCEPNPQCPTASGLFYRTFSTVLQLQYLYGNDTIILIDSLMPRPDKPPHKPHGSMGWYC